MNQWNNTIKLSIGTACVLFGLAVANWAHAATVSFSLRYQDALVFSGPMEIPAVGTVSMSDSNGIQRQVSSQSVLGMLSAVDEQSSAFAVSQLTYYASFNSLYLKCVQIANPAVNACDNWQYAVNGSNPFVGMDSYALQPNDQVFLYFGNPRQAALPKNTMLAGESFAVSAQKYQYQDNTWVPLLGVTIGVTLPNPQDSFSPIETVTQSVDGIGNAFFTIPEAGDYSVGIKEDFYFPSVSLRVLPRIAGGGVSPVSFAPVPAREFDIARAIDFLASRQNQDGSFEGNPMLSDRAAVALGAYGQPIEVREKLKSYLLANPDPGSLVTDYERRAMALMALGVSPYSGVGADYIAKIVASFDGTQIGDAGLVNDDLFALVVLQNAGYREADPMIAKITEFVLSRQLGNGSWGDVDYTAAAMQALVFQQNEPVRNALAKAKTYLASQQKDSGGFADNLYSTAWATQALGALGEESGAWQKNGKSPKDFLSAHQADDGGLEQGDTVMNRIWITSDAIPAALGKPWSAILGTFSKPALPQLPAASFQLPAVDSQQQVNGELKAERQKSTSPGELSEPASPNLPLRERSEASQRGEQEAVEAGQAVKFPEAIKAIEAVKTGRKEQSPINNQQLTINKKQATESKKQEVGAAESGNLTAAASTRENTGIVQRAWNTVKTFAAKFLNFFQKRFIR